LPYSTPTTTVWVDRFEELSAVKLYLFAVTEFCFFLNDSGSWHCMRYSGQWASPSTDNTKCKAARLWCGY
jgi:hypothetical protein